MNAQTAARVSFAVALLTLTGCTSAPSKVHCFDQREWDAIVAEKAPCRLPALSNADVLQAVRDEQGQPFFDDPKLGPRPYRIRSVDCHYEVEYVVFGFNGAWAGFDAIDGTSFMLVGR